MKSVRIKISGLVQGIYFRKYIADEAKKLGILGHVRNLESGEVEVMAEGSLVDVDKMIASCKKGSPHSKIKTVDIQDINHIGFEDFKILDI